MTTPNYTTGKLVTNVSDFKNHVEGSGFNHTADQINLNPNVDGYTTVQEAIEAITNVLPPVIEQASSTEYGIVRLSGGDIGGTAGALRVVNIQGYPVENVAPTNDYILTWESSTTQWRPKANNATIPAATSSVLGGVKLLGDLGGDASTGVKIVGLAGTGSVGSASVDVTARDLIFASTLVAPSLKQANTSGAASQSLYVLAQSSTDSSGVGGTMYLRAGAGDANSVPAYGGNITLNGGNASTNTGGALTVAGGGGANHTTGGAVTVIGGSGTTTGGLTTISGGNSSTTGGNVSVTGGSGTTAGGNITISSGTGTAATNNGTVSLRTGSTTLLEASSKVSGRNIISLFRNSAVSGTQVPSGNGVLYISSATTDPSEASPPTSGSLLYNSPTTGKMTVMDLEGSAYQVGNPKAAENTAGDAKVKVYHQYACESSVNTTSATLFDITLLEGSVWYLSGSIVGRDLASQASVVFDVGLGIYFSSGAETSIYDIGTNGVVSLGGDLSLDADPEITVAGSTLSVTSGNKSATTIAWSLNLTINTNYDI